MTKDEALKLALEALKRATNYDPVIARAITAIKEALANEALERKAENARELGLNYEPDPVAWEQFYPDMGNPKLAYLSPTESPDNACYIPPQRKPLTDLQIGQILDDPNIAEAHQGHWRVLPFAYARAIEAAHGIKGEA